MSIRVIVGVVLTVMMFGVASAQEEIGPVGMWQFEEESGLAVMDTSGNGLDGKLYNPENVKRVEGKVGKALEFSGTERYKGGCVLVPGMKKLDLSKGFTFETWIRFNDKHVRQDTCYIASDGAWKGPGWRFIIYYNTLAIQSGDGKDGWGANSKAAEHGGFENNRWYHVAATYDGSVYKVYLDGVEAGSSKPNLKLTKGSDTLTIGSYSGGMTSVFKGTIDEIRLYNQAKSALEIAKDARIDVLL
ncbi:MAG: LamG domain-containing protein [bacterium]|nr:LamG domain-containing protein [bacterium]